MTQEKKQASLNRIKQAIAELETEGITTEIIRENQEDYLPLEYEYSVCKPDGSEWDMVMQLEDRIRDTREIAVTTRLILSGVKLEASDSIPDIKDYDDAFFLIERLNRTNVENWEEFERRFGLKSIKQDEGKPGNGVCPHLENASRCIETH